jgi:ribosomal protein S18 acetylase RimI-like enzyme
VTGPAAASIAALAISPMTDGEVEAVVALWERCGLTRPWNDPRADIALARRGPASAILVGREGDAVVASAMVGHDGHRGWVYYVAVDPACQKRGFGRAIMEAAENWLRQAGVPKLQLLVRRDNARASAFYETIGYDEAQVTVFAKWLDGRES